jgi:hypothetical protein
MVILQKTNFLMGDIVGIPPLLVIRYKMYTRLCEMAVFKASEYGKNYEE